MKSGPQRINYRWLRRGVLMVFLIAIGWGFASIAAKRIANTNFVRPAPIEERHLSLAREAEGDLKLDFTRSVSGPLKQWLPHRTDGVVQPLWPWISAWMADAADTTPERLMLSAGWLQLGLTLGFLVVLGIVCGRSFSLPAAMLVPLLVGFHGLLPAVGQFTGDALFQILFLLTWVTCIYGLQRNSLWVYGLAGTLGALAYLTDERALPLLLVFGGVSTLRALWQWLAEHWPRQAGTSLWVPRNHILGMLLMGAMFSFIAGPRLVEAHQRFGTPFFHYQNQVRWLDDQETARAWIDRYPDERRLTAIPASDRPSLDHYLREHPRDVVWERLRQGAQDVATAFGNEGGREIGVLFLILAAMTVALPLATPKAVHAGQRLHPETVPAVLFMVLSVAAYVGLAAWDVPMAGTHQRLLLLQAPLALAIVWGSESLSRRARRRKARRAFLASYQSLLWLMVILQSWRVIQGLQVPLSAP